MPHIVMTYGDIVGLALLALFLSVVLLWLVVLALCKAFGWLVSIPARIRNFFPNY